MLPRLFEGFVAAVLRRPGVAAAAALAVMAGGAALGTRTTLADDARALLADADPEVHAQLWALSEFTAVDNLLVVLDGRGYEAALLPAAAAAKEVLDAHPEAFRRARYEIEPAEQLEVAARLMPLRFLLDPRDPESLLAPEALRRSLALVRARVLAPEGMLAKEYLTRDPFDSVATTLAGLQALPGLPQLDASSGRFFSRDGSALLLIAEPVGNPFAGSDAARTMAVISEAETKVATAAPGVRLRVIGAHRFARDAEAIIRHDVHFGVVTSLVAVLLIFWIFFRRLRLVLVALPPLLFGACIAAAVAGLLCAPVHGIVLAFAGSCLGLAIDYTVYLMATVAAVGGGARAALPTAARRLGGSMHLLVGTTLAGLGALLLSHVAAMQQMGLIAAGAVAGAFCGALVWVPIVLPLVSPEGTLAPLSAGPWTWAVRSAMRRPRWLLAAVSFVAVALAGLAAQTRVDGDLRHLDTHTAAARADEARFLEAFGDPATSGLALVTAPSLDAGLALAERVVAALHAAGLTEVLSPTALAPSAVTRAARHEGWCHDAGARQATFREQVVAAGFRPEAFAALAADWQRLCREPLADAKDGLALMSGIVGRPVVRAGADGRVRLAVAFDGTAPEMAAARAALSPIAGVTYVHRQALNERLVAVIGQDLPRLGLWSLALVTVILVIGLGGLWRPFCALAPAGLAVLAFFGVMAATDTPINLMNLCVLPLLNGSGTDYGILMAYADADADHRALEARAFGLTVAAATTLAGFGPMAFADYYALATIGRSVLLAIGAAALFALVVPPALLSLKRRRREPASPSAAVPARALEIRAPEPKGVVYDAVIIGSGMSGLTSAVILAKEGMRVLVLEQHYRIGGYLHRFFREGGVQFDVGFHYVGGVERGQVLGTYLDYCGVRDRLQLIPFDRDGYDELRFPGRTVLIPSGYERYRQRLIEAFPRERAGIEEYCRALPKIVDAFAFYRLRFDQDLAAADRYMSLPLARFVGGLTADPMLGAVLCGQSPLYGVEPRRAPVGLHALVTDTFMQGAYTFAGGGDALTQAMGARIEELGGAVETRRKVTEILVDRARQVEGVRTDRGEEARARLVVSAAHPKVTAALLPDGVLRPGYKRRLLNMEDGVATVSVFVTTRADLSAYRGRNVYNYKTTDIDDLYADKEGARGRRFAFVTVPSAREGVTRDGRHLAVGLGLMSYGQVARWAETERGHRGADYEAFKAKAGDEMLALMTEVIPELAGQVVSIEVGTPLTNRDYAMSQGGAAYGIHHSVEQSGRYGLRPRVRVSGLYLTGQSVLMPGVCGVTISAFHTCSHILGSEYLIKKVNAGG
ncbi:MAG: FAD-dependent oxidoreductase [Deltaproteobacteria bacterium]|nr:FAD-dependent oxidoreductase [Deltaproteobacteria bacterium]